MTYDVVVMGEVLVELHSAEPLRRAHPGTGLRLGYSGDALNAAAAAAAAGARTALLTVVADDELSVPLLERVEELGVSVELVRRADRSNGAYLVSADVAGDREFVYWRSGSAASTLGPEDAKRAAGAGALMVSGITAALSASAREAVLAGARLVHGAGGHVTYDPNFRRKLTSEADARTVLREIAPFAGLLTPSCPGDSRPLLGTDEPREVAARLAAVVAVTSGAAEVFVADGATEWTVPVPVNPDPVDATGAGDVFAGTTTARLALGDSLKDAVRYGVAAASLSVSGAGGTGHIPAFAETRELADGC